MLGATYRFAKTMKDNPHWYTLRESWESGKDFEEVVKFIRKNGYYASWFQHLYIYYVIDDHKYWTMGAPVKETILINKAEI